MEKLMNSVEYIEIRNTVSQEIQGSAVVDLLKESQRKDLFLNTFGIVFEIKRMTAHSKGETT